MFQRRRQTHKWYRKLRRDFYLFIFFPAAAFAILNRAAEEYARIKALQEKNSRRP